MSDVMCDKRDERKRAHDSGEPRDEEVEVLSGSVADGSHQE